jgi:hypothetical protein
VGYFTINAQLQQGFIDWDWLLTIPPIEERTFTNHLSFETPIVIKINGRQNKGIILKPEGYRG